MGLDEITWNELTEVEVGEDICWPSIERDSNLNLDYPCVDSEDYYPDQGKFLLPKTWNPPEKDGDLEPRMIETDLVWLKAQIEDTAKIFLLSKDFIAEECDDYRCDFSTIKKVDGLKNATIFAFPRKYILPVKAGSNSRQSLAVFYDDKNKKYLRQYVFAEIKDNVVTRNDSYEDNNAEREYKKACESYADYVSEIAHSETSTNYRIFGIDARSAFLKSAKENYDKY